MYNFYQSKVRQDIQKLVYKNPTFEVHLFWKKYFWIIKEKNIGPISLKRYQVLWVELPQDQHVIVNELKYLKQKFKSQYANIFFQMGVVNEIVKYANSSRTCPDFAHEMREARLDLRKFFKNTFSLQTSFRENMPQSGILYDVTQSDENLLKQMNESCRKRIKKAQADWLEFSELSPDQYENFYLKWQATAGKKGFNIIRKEQYVRLLEYIEKNNAWKVLIVSKDGEIVAGSIGLYGSPECLVCMYGFSDRNFWKIWLNHYLKFKTFGWAREHGFAYVDTMGGAPTWFPEHPLTPVTEFKESLWGDKIEFYGNYDIPLSGWLYRVFKMYFSLLHK